MFVLPLLHKGKATYTGYTGSQCHMGGAKCVTLPTLSLRGKEHGQVTHSGLWLQSSSLYRLQWALYVAQGL